MNINIDNLTIVQFGMLAILLVFGVLVVFGETAKKGRKK